MTQQSQPTRRKFLAGSAAAGGAAITGFPMIAKAQTVNLRFQSTWPAKDIFHEYANDFAKKVNDMAGGRLKIEVLPAGSVVKAFDLLDAVSKGTLDGGHGVVACPAKSAQSRAAHARPGPSVLPSRALHPLGR